MFKANFKVKLAAEGYLSHSNLNFISCYNLTIVEPLDDFIIVKSLKLENAQASIAFGFVYKRDSHNKILTPTVPEKIYCYNTHVLRKEFGMTTSINFTTVDDLVERVKSTSQSLINLFETK